jgi:hypothetical protein
VIEGTSVTFANYAEARVQKTGGAYESGAPDSWVTWEGAALVRVPTFSVAPVSKLDVARILRRERKLVASWLTEPDVGHPPNAVLYRCLSYSTENLPDTVRRHIKRSKRELQIGPLSRDTLLADAYPAFCETRSRQGLADTSRKHFDSRFRAFTNLPGHHAIGAWHEGRLIAFATIIWVDNWAEIDGLFSVTGDRGSRPNNGLVDRFLSWALNEKKLQLVSYGLSSVQERSKAQDGLHEFKTHVGFEAHPVYRAFASHPLFSPFVNRTSRWLLSSALRLRPGNRRLRKARGVLDQLIHTTEISR